MKPNSSESLIHFHLREVRALRADHIFNQATQNRCLRPPRLYSAAVDGIWSTSLCPEKVLLTRIPTGPTQEEAEAAVHRFKVKLALSSSHHKFCFLGNGPAADDGGQNYVDPAPNRGSTYIPDLNVSPPNETAPTTDFVGDIKNLNISRFTDHVVCWLGDEVEAAAYKNTLRSITAETDIASLDSIKIWNRLTLGDEILKTLVAKGLVEAPLNP